MEMPNMERGTNFGSEVFERENVPLARHSRETKRGSVAGRRPLHERFTPFSGPLWAETQRGLCRG